MVIIIKQPIKYDSVAHIYICMCCTLLEITAVTKASTREKAKKQKLFAYRRT